jgi:hypothetical protein
VLCVGAFLDFGGGGGVGKDIDMGRGLLCGITTSFFSPSRALSSLELLIDVTRLAVEGSRTLLARPSPTDALGLPREGALLVASLL